MAVYFVTEKPKTLLKEFIRRVNQEEAEGKITTWVQHDDGKHFTHTSTQWKNKAFMKPTAETERIVFNIIKPKGKPITWPVYAFYHGHLIETFITHFHDDFSEAQATPLPDASDNCGE